MIVSPEPSPGRRAVVLGGSLAGLLASVVLARHFDQVVIVERDDLAHLPDGPRRGVPQGRHSHGLLVSGSRAMEQLLPGLTDELVARGAIRTDLLHRAKWCFNGIEQARFDSGMIGLMVSRPLIEDAVRRRVLALPEVRLLAGYDITGLSFSDDRRRVLGARLASNQVASDHVDRAAEPLIEDDDELGGVVLGDLVVDATGRASRAATWLAELGYAAVPEEVVEAGMTYVTRRFHQRAGVLDELDAEIVGADPSSSRSGVALRQEDGTWTVTIVGAFGERPPSELAAFQAYARSLPTQGLAEVATGCEPATEPLTYHYPSSRWLRWDKLSRRPEGFTVIGDAVCSFNPVYGQGMSSAALQAVALEQALAGGLAGLPARAAKGFAQVIATPWTLATGADRRHVSQPAKPLPERLLDRYLDRLLAVAPHDREVAMAFSQVLNLLAPPPSLLAPRIARRVLRPARRRPQSRAKHSLAA
jgi:2-polyprenyl-6-methoxyphenol hydroxylase-like FAD-dependent oxidoreductase